MLYSHDSITSRSIKYNGLVRIGKAIAMERQVGLSMLWVFLVVNFLYADILALFDSVYNGKISGVQFTQALLVSGAVLVEIPMVMIILSRVLKYKANRWINIIAGIAYTVDTLVTQFIVPIMNGTTTSYYLFFGAIEIPTTLFIVWYAWKWAKP